MARREYFVSCQVPANRPSWTPCNFGNHELILSSMTHFWLLREKTATCNGNYSHLFFLILDDAFGVPSPDAHLDPDFAPQGKPRGKL